MVDTKESIDSSSDFATTRIKGFGICSVFRSSENATVP
jgi:hypothetical protein